MYKENQELCKPNAEVVFSFFLIKVGTYANFPPLRKILANIYTPSPGELKKFQSVYAT